MLFEEDSNFAAAIQEIMGDDESSDDEYYYDPDFDFPEDKCEEFSDLEQRNNGTGVFSLQDICLISISKNLPRFNLAFSVTERNDFRRNLLVLRRFHSSYLIKYTTKENGKLDESYFDFLLNEYVKELDMSILFKCDWDVVLKRISEIGHGLQKVFFNFPLGISVRGSMIDLMNKIIPYLPNAKALNFNPYCDDSTLEIIAKSCLQLKELHFSDNSVTDKGIKSLCKENDNNMTTLKLTHLSLPRSADIKEGIAYILQNMPSIEVISHLDLPYILYKLHKNNLDNSLERKYNLTSLFLPITSPWQNTPSMTDVLTLYGDVCPHIKEVFLPLESREHLDLCCRFQELESFRSNSNAFNLSLDFNDFFQSKGGLLRKLQIENVSFSVTTLLQNCLKLETLDLQSITFQSLRTRTTFQPLNNLQHLSLAYFSFGDDLVRQSVFNILNSCPNVEKFSISGCRFENSEEFVTKLSKFCENETLKYLRFSNCDVDDAFLQSVLLTGPKLKTLTIKDCENITESHIGNLYEILSSLKSQTKIIYSDDRSEFNSINSGDDIYDDYTENDSDFDHHELYDSDSNLYYGYESDGY